jgi:hypothetical protein
MIFRRHRNCTREEIEAAKTATEESASTASKDLETQRSRLNEERKTIVPMLRRLHDQNHVAEALIRVLETGRRHE